MFIVPNYLSDQIYAAIDAQLALVPDAAPHREDFYHQLLGYFNENGVIPDFSLVKNAQSEPHQ